MNVRTGAAAPVFCAVCFGDATSTMARAIWPGVYLLLGVVAIVLVPIVVLGFTWARRERRQTPS